MGRPSPLPPVSAVLDSSSRVNRWNTRSRSASAMPGPSSSTSITKGSARPSTVTRTVVVCVALRVLDEVDDDPAKVVGIQMGREVPARQTTGDGHSRRDRVDGGGDHLACVHIDRVAGQFTGVGPGQQDQVGHDSGEPFDVDECVVDEIRSRPVPSRDVELGAQRGQGTAQFVGGVRDEGPLAVPGGGEPRQHVVEGDCQGTDLIVGGGNRENFVRPRP